jgi:hypothetical protein
MYRQAMHATNFVVGTLIGALLVACGPSDALPERSRAEPREPPSPSIDPPEREAEEPVHQQLAGEPSSAREEVSPMDEREFMRLFHTVEFDRGAPYVRARDQLVLAGEGARPHLDRYSSDPDRGRAQAAQVVLGWIDHGDEYRRCSDLLLRRVPPPRLFPEMAYAPEVQPAVKAMHPLVVPRMIELLLKTDEIRFRDEHSWYLLTDSMEIDHRYVEPLAVAMQDERRSTAERIIIAETLYGSYSDLRALEFAESVAWDARAAAEHRLSAFHLLATAERYDVLPRVRAELEDPTTPEQTLLVYASAVVYFRDSSAVDALLRILPRARSAALRLEIATTLGLLEDPRAIPEVARTVDSDPDREVREAAENALRRLRWRQRLLERERQGGRP